MTELENEEQRNNANVLLCVVEAIADQYDEQVRFEKLYQQDKREKIKELEQMISKSVNANIYKMFYKPEYGDYRQYTEEVAKELRRRHALDITIDDKRQ